MSAQIGETPPSAPLHPGGCPRCGTRITKDYKYCPNCAYRLRPDLSQAPAARVTRKPGGLRAIGLGGYLAFASLLLLVVLAGIRLFTEPDVFLGVTEQSGVARDPNVLPLDRARGFVRVEGGDVIWGLSMPPQGPLTEDIVDDAFSLSIYEITNDQYYGFLKARVARSGQPLPQRLYPDHWTRLTGDRMIRRIYARREGNFPVTSVDFRAAMEFCAWLWEAKFQQDPNLIVDLPTADEYVRAARGEFLDRNFPWDGPLERGRANLDGAPVAVDDPRGLYGGFFALVGDAAEWVHGPEGFPAAAGWSFEDADKYAIWDNFEVSDKPTPFRHSGVETIRGGLARPYVGFRVAVRRAPEMPVFVRVSAGRARHRPSRRELSRILPPKRGTLTEERESPVVFKQQDRRVERNFELAQTEITNRQYLAYLVDEARVRSKVRDLRPPSFRRPHPMADWNAFIAEYGDPRLVPDDEFKNLEVTSVYMGPYGDPQKIPFLYEAGEENRPVKGIAYEQAEAYAEWLRKKMVAHHCRIPTVAEFLRAGRGDGLSPYPGKLGPLDAELICSGRADDMGRAVSLAGRFGPGIHGLAGNLPEFVWDRSSDQVLIAGGFYKLPAEHCTLDTFFSELWDYVDLELPGAAEGDKPVRQRFELGQYTGFRVVRVPH